MALKFMAIAVRIAQRLWASCRSKGQGKARNRGEN